MDFFGNDFSVAAPTDYGSYGGYEQPFSWDIPTSESLYPTAETFSLFPSPSFATDGASLIESRANTSFWNFDQSKITNGIGDVLGSVLTAGAKTALQGSSDAINRGANQQGQVGSFFRNFRSTQTGAQINAGAYATRIQNFFANPLVWFGAIILVAVIFFLRR
jgi:hypothetical protein